MEYLCWQPINVEEGNGPNDRLCIDSDPLSLPSGHRIDFLLLKINLNNVVVINVIVIDAWAPPLDNENNCYILIVAMIESHVRAK